MLSVRQGAKAVEFFKAAFGARELLRIDGESGSLVAQLAAEDAEFWVADESPEHADFSPASPGGGTVRMVMTVDDPDAIFSRRAGGGHCNPAGEQSTRLAPGRVADPFGHRWEIGRPL